MDGANIEGDKAEKDATKKALARNEAERKRVLDEQEEHRATVAREMEASKTELQGLLEKLTAPERKQVRLHAYLSLLNGGWGTPNNLQAAVDEQTQRLARYMVGGVV